MNIKNLLKIYGLKLKDFKKYKFYEYKQDLWITTEEVLNFKNFRIHKRGIKIARRFLHGIKPTTAFAQLFGNLSKKNFVFIKDEDLKTFINGGTVKAELTPDYKFVIVKWKSYPIGIGLYKEGKVKSQIPGSRRNVD